MHERKLRYVSAMLWPLLFLGLTPPHSAAQARSPRVLNPPKQLLLIDGKLVPHPLAISVGSIRVMPQVKVKVTPGEEKKSATYSGVLLATLLKQVGVPIGSQSAGKASFTVTAIGGSGEKVVLPPAEANSLLHGNNELIVADAVNGKPLPKQTGPLQLIITTDKNSSRWVKDLTRIQVNPSQ